jgi:hypothetical protein
MTRLARFCFFTVCLAGCGEEPGASAPQAAPAAVATSEPLWDAQLAAVREGRSDEIHVSSAALSSEQFREIGDRCEAVRTLLLDHASIGNADLDVLAKLPKLRRLKLPFAVDDSGIDEIAGCRELENLNLPAGVFTDSGCSRIAELDRLILLRFGSPNVTDEGVRALAKLPHLRFLHLLDVPITDACLDDIASIDTLESFYLDGGRTTGAGLRKLLAERPDLHVHLDQLHLPDDPNAHE